MLPSVGTLDVVSTVKALDEGSCVVDSFVTIVSWVCNFVETGFSGIWEVWFFVSNASVDEALVVGSSVVEALVWGTSVVESLVSDPIIVEVLVREASVVSFSWFTPCAVWALVSGVCDVWKAELGDFLVGEFVDFGAIVVWGSIKGALVVGATVFGSLVVKASVVGKVVVGALVEDASTIFVASGELPEKVIKG